MEAKLHILLVEDNPGDTELLEDMIFEGSLKDSTIKSVETLEEATIKVQQERFDIILLDLGLPDSTGMDTLSNLLKLAQKVPIIVLTGFDDEKAGLTAINLGAQDYLVKGHVDPHMFARIVLYSIERKKTSQRIAHLNRVLKSIRSVNQLIVQERDVDKLIVKSCGILTETRGYLNACIILVDNDMKPCKTSLQKDKKGYSNLFHLLENGGWRGGCFKTLKKNYIHIINDPEMECGNCPLKSESQGSKTVSIKLEFDQKIYGVFSVNIPKNIDVNAEEGLIKEVAGDISFALHSIEVEEDRKRAEEELKRAKERYEKAEESAHLGHWEMDIATGEGIWSDEFFRICGFEPDAFKPTAGISIKSIHPDDRERVVKAVQEAIKQQKSIDIEKRIVRPNGEVRYVHSIGKIIFDENQQPVKLQGSFLDITERKKAEKLQETFYKVSNAVNTTENIQELYRRIQDYLGNVLDTKNFYIALYDNKKIYISFVYYADESFKDKEYLPPRRRFGRGLTEYVISTEKPLFATRRMQDQMAKQGDIEIMGSRSEIWMGVPLRIENETIGAIAVQSYNDPQLYSRSDIDILTFISQEIALAIHRK